MPKAVENFKKALIDGTIDPYKLNKMTSEERHAIFSKIVGENSAKDVNSLFEAKTLLKNQNYAYTNWAQKVAGLSPEDRNTLTDKIAKLDHVLNPAEEKAFLHDLVSTRLGVTVSAKEAQHIAQLSKTVEETKALPRSSTTAAMDKKWTPTANDMKHGYALHDFHQYMSDLKNEARKVRLADIRGRNITAAPAHLLRSVADISKSIGASLDDSFALRQGAKAFWTNNGAWRKQFVESFRNIAKGFKNTEVADREFNARLMADPHYNQAIKDGLAIHGNEDAFPTSVPEKIPVLGRAFGASEVAYNAFAQNLRLDIYKQQMKLAANLGDTIPKTYGKNMAKMVNSLTGRGGFGKAEPVSGYFNMAFYSLRFLKSNVDTLLLHPAGIGIGGVGSAAQKEAAKSLVKIIAGTAGVLATANAIKPGSVEWDPRSADFGMIKIGHTRFNVSAGMSSIITLAARVATSSSKSSTTGVVSKLNSGGFGAPTIKDVIVSFLTNKTSPIGGVALDFASGKTHNNTKPTIANEAGNLIEPLNVKNFTELRGDPNSANLLAAMLADTFGISTNTYGKSQKNNNLAPSPSMQAFKQKVGNQKFQQANNDYNTALDKFMADHRNQLNALSNSEKAKAISGAKAKIQKTIYQKYGFSPPKAKASPGRMNLLQSIH